MLKLPVYDGGNQSFNKFISENIRYPQEAIQANIEGSVIVAYDISDNGVVENPRILKGLGHGCDEEAIRVIRMLNYEKVKNRKVRVKLTKKTTIHFRLPKVGISYTVTPAKSPDAPLATPPPAVEGASYTYTIDY